MKSKQVNDKPVFISGLAPRLQSFEDRVMVIRDSRGRECLKFRTPSGVTAWVDTSITMEVIEGFIRKLEAKLASRRQRSRR